MGLLESEAWVWGNLGESLISLGRWDEAAEAAVNAQNAGQSAKPRGGAALKLALLSLHRGEVGEAARHLTAARDHYGTHDAMPQTTLPMATLTIGVAAAEGRLLDARAVLEGVLGPGLPPATHRDAWPLLLIAAAAESEARGLPVAEPGRDETLERIRKTAKSLAAAVPVWQAHALWVRAELLRAEGRDTADAWSEVVTAVEPLERPYDLARVRYRLAEALLTSGTGASGSGASGSAEDGRDRATELLRLAHAVACHLGARPLADATALLAQRARLTLFHRSGPPAADPVEALGLTSRERDVLRLVAEGRSNRQIAEELFISPKTASVHVSNILAKLDVSGRGEAAALAHRLRLFPAGPGDRLAAG